MSVESDLKKDGIVVIKKLDTLRVNTIARNVAIRLCETFPDFGLNQNDLFIKLSILLKCLKVWQKQIIFIKIHLSILMTT